MLIAALAAGTLAAPTFAQDIDGSSDHPLLSRFDGAFIAAYQLSDFGEVQLPSGPVEDENAREHILELEGRMTRIGYHVPGNKTALEVIRNYEDALTSSDFTTAFSCAGRECGRRFVNFVTQTDMFPRGFDRTAVNDRSRALLATGLAGDIPVHVFLYVMEDQPNQRTLIRQIVVEGEPMPLGAVTVRDADALRSDLEQAGRTVVDGIFFETNSAVIRTDSEDALEQMALLLDDNADLSVYIVGHTDNVGALSYNLDLSLRRASAVAEALTERFAIAPNRLSAQGVANLAPLSNNVSEAGRTLNRRVELVLQ